ncbi:MAG: TerC family protein [Planctomycetota bacterium]
MSLAYLASIAQIILIDIVLSGDNAVVLAMAAHRLPPYQRKQAIMWGGGIAITMRIIFTMVMAFLLMVPGVRLFGGMVLAWIACKLLGEEEEHSVAADDADRTAMAAIRMIFVADFVMSLDNMLAVAGASHGDWQRLLLGLIVSIAIIMTCSSYIARLMNRYKWIVTVGAGILALTAAQMMSGDREVASFFVHRVGVCLNSHWEDDYLATHAHVANLSADQIPVEVQDRVELRKTDLLFTGQMSSEQRDALLAAVSTSEDKEAIEGLYEQSRQREVPNWVPEAWRTSATHFFQRKWPVEDSKKLAGHHYHFVAWIFNTLVIVACLTSPIWRRKLSASDQPAAASEQGQSQDDRG